MTTIKKNPGPPISINKDAHPPIRFVLKNPGDGKVLAESRAMDYFDALKEFRESFPTGEYVIRSTESRALAQVSTSLVERWAAAAAKGNALFEHATRVSPGMWRMALNESTKSIARLDGKPDTAFVLYVLRIYQRYCAKQLETAKRDGGRL